MDLLNSLVRSLNLPTNANLANLDFGHPKWPKPMPPPTAQLTALSLGGPRAPGSAVRLGAVHADTCLPAKVHLVSLALGPLEGEPVRRGTGVDGQRKGRIRVRKSGCGSRKGKEEEEEEE